MSLTFAAVLPLPPLDDFGPAEALGGAFILTVALVASAHAVIYKREPRSAALWVVLIWTLPAAGAVLYLLLGINRVRRRATALRRQMVRHRTEPPLPATEGALAAQAAAHLLPLTRLVNQVIPRPLLAGNSIAVLRDGAAAYPAMLDAIASARTSIAMASYIFDGHGIGAEFVAALAGAHRRGVAVRVLIDDVDARFSRSTAVAPLRRAGVNTGVFNPPLFPARLSAVHLRNHRKILVVDGHAGFTGGINIDERYWRPQNPASACKDLHFRLNGPIVAHLMEVFADDWHFTTGQSLQGPTWFPPLQATGAALARGIEAGPDENYERLRWVIIGALNGAQRSVRILTPYFVPDAALISTLNAAAMRGVEVDILLPEVSDLAHIHWATFGQLWQVLERGCRVWLTPPSFDHSKLMVVDGVWTLFGSANWDARSLRLNFELNVECYCAALGAELEQMIGMKRGAARRIRLADVDQRSLPVKLRDGFARMFAPFL